MSLKKYAEAVVNPLGIPMPELETLRPVLINHTSAVKGQVFVHPFASKGTKAYPYAKELAEMLLENGYTPIFAGMGGSSAGEGDHRPYRQNRVE